MVAFPCSHSAHCTCTQTSKAYTTLLKKRHVHIEMHIFPSSILMWCAYKLPFSATQAKIFHPYYNVVASNSWILRNFHSKLCPLRTSTYSPAVGPWIVPCVTVKPTSILPSEFDQISSANTRMPNACRNRHTGKLLNPQLLPLPLPTCRCRPFQLHLMTLSASNKLTTVSIPYQRRSCVHAAAGCGGGGGGRPAVTSGRIALHRCWVSQSLCLVSSASSSVGHELVNP
jgi:hypothetical protein